jgi:hypothetical protein
MTKTKGFAARETVEAANQFPVADMIDLDQRGLAISVASFVHTGAQGAEFGIEGRLAKWLLNICRTARSYLQSQYLKARSAARSQATNKS